jgi:predicted acetyltransferase
MRPIQSEIRPLSHEDFLPLVDLSADAYPAMKLNTEEEKKLAAARLQDQASDPLITYYGVYRNQKLVGGMRLHNFSMQCYETQMKIGGVGMVAVDLLHKKEKIARDMLIYYLDHYHAQGYPMAILYPFRPDFYRKMGFGYGTKVNRYELKPAVFPTGPKDHLRSLERSDGDALQQCYQRVMNKTHGMIAKGKSDLNRLFNPPANRLVGMELDGALRGYLVYKFSSKRPDNFIYNDLEVLELVYENRQALQELLSFLNSQADQIHDIILTTQDEDLHHLVADPRNPSENLFHSVSHETNTQGVGIMYRVLNTRKWFEELSQHNFNQQTLRVNFNIMDTFLPQNNGCTIVHFKNGWAKLADNGFDVEVRMDVSDFSSWVMGCVQFNSLFHYGRADLSDECYLDTVNRLFFTSQKPICYTEF